jgi:hypothetical protein
VSKRAQHLGQASRVLDLHEVSRAGKDEPVGMRSKARQSAACWATLTGPEARLLPA